MPVHDLLNHALRHVYLYLSGDRSEAHLPHAAWGLLAAIHSETLWPHLNAHTLRGPGCTPPDAHDSRRVGDHQVDTVEGVTPTRRGRFDSVDPANGYACLSPVRDTLNEAWRNRPMDISDRTTVDMATGQHPSADFADERGPSKYFVKNGAFYAISNGRDSTAENPHGSDPRHDRSSS